MLSGITMSCKSRICDSWQPFGWTARAHVSYPGGSGFKPSLGPPLSCHRYIVSYRMTVSCCVIMRLIPGYSCNVWNKNKLCYLFSNEWQSRRSSCNPITNRNFITPVALMLGRCHSEGLWVISHVNESNLRRTALRISLLKGKLWDAASSKWFRSAVLASTLSNACQTNVVKSMLLIPPPSLYSASHAVNFLT